MLGMYSLNGTAIVKVKNLKEKYGYIVQKRLMKCKQTNSH